MLVGLVAVVCVSVVLLTMRGVRGTAVVLVYVAAFTASMLELRVLPWLLVADVALIAALALTLLTNPRLSIAGYQRPLFVIVLIGFGGLLGAGAGGNDAVVSLGKFVLATGAPIVVMALLRPSRSEVRTMAAAYVTGVMVCGGIGLFTDRTGGDRVVGLSTHPNHLALASAIAIPIALGLSTSARWTVRRQLWMLAAVGLGVLIVLTGSRSGAFAAVIGVGAVLVKERRIRLVRRLLVLAAVAVVAVASGVINLGEQSLIARLTSAELTDRSDINREARAADAWEAIGRNPILGNGFTDVLEAHSAPLQLWQSAGILGVAAFLVLVLLAVQHWRRAARGDGLVAGLWCGMIGYLAATPISNQLWDRYIWVPLAVAVAGTVAAQTEPAEVVDRPPRRTRIRIAPRPQRVEFRPLRDRTQVKRAAR